MKNIFLMLMIVLAMVVGIVADAVNVVQIKMPSSDNIVKIHGELLEDIPNDCKSGIALKFMNKNGFSEDVYMGADVGFRDLKSVEFMQIYRPGDTEIVFCVPEKLFDNGSFEYQAGVVESIFLWSPAHHEMKLAKAKDLEINSSLTTKESVITDPIFWFLMVVLVILAGYKFKNYKKRREMRKK